MKLPLLFVALASLTLYAADSSPAARATNQLGLDLHRRLAARAPAGNLCISPYSIQSALAMTFAGADGATREEMATALHFTGGDKIHGAFAALATNLEASVKKSETVAKDGKKYGGPSEPITLTGANRLYGQKGHDFRKPFLTILENTYDAPFQPVDFSRAGRVTGQINSWVAKQTRDRIQDLIPGGTLDARSRLVLVNALYFKAPWRTEFSQYSTAPAPFHGSGGAARKVSTMQRTGMMGYKQGRGYRAVALPYAGDNLQFLILLPNAQNGLVALEKTLTAGTLAECAKLPEKSVALHLPKFKLESGSIALAKELQALGLKSAFDLPTGSANFDRMAPRRADDYLAIDNVFHKTFIALDERGTEAAAATAVTVFAKGEAPKPDQPIEVKVDRPFLFAIQHKPSGACLFLGRVTNP